MPALPVILFVVFLVLKLTGVIAWSWIWVTAPLWIGLILALVITLTAWAIYGAALGAFFKMWNRR